MRDRQDAGKPDALEGAMTEIPVNLAPHGGGCALLDMKKYSSGISKSTRIALFHPFFPPGQRKAYISEYNPSLAESG